MAHNVDDLTLGKACNCSACCGDHHVRWLMDPLLGAPIAPWWPPTITQTATAVDSGSET